MAGHRVGRRARLLVPVVAIVLALAACSGDVDDTEGPGPTTGGEQSTGTDEPTTPAPRPVSEATQPDEPYALLPQTDAGELAIAVSRTYLTQAQVAVIAPHDDRDAVLRAASIGAAVGAPVLLTGNPSSAAASVDTELLRLGVVGVVTVGRVDLAEIDTTSLVIAPAPDDVGDLGDLFGVALTDVPLPSDDADDIGALLELEPGQVFGPGAPDQDSSESPESAESPESSEPGTDETSSAATPATTSPSGTPTADPTPVGELPPLAPPVRIDSALVLADGEPGQLAAIATALAAGADATRVTGDVRGSPRVIELLHETAPASVVGLGTGMGGPEEFVWRTQTAATGVQLPGGGQLLFDDKRYIALYGSPVTPALGVLGEQGTAETIARAAEFADRYADLTEDEVVPALEIIVTVASSSAGDDGNYSNEWSIDTFLPLIEAAHEAGQYVVLDFQPGRTPFLEQVKQYEELLAYPNVGVALDPEWRLRDDQVHLEQIGSVDIDEVNQVVEYLADFVQSRHLPQKLLVLHQFQLRMITDRQDLDTSRTELAVLIHADGLGSQGAKQATWRTLHQDAPEGVRWGWKNFIDEDQPMLTPEQTYSQVDPVPDFVSYQ